MTFTGLNLLHPEQNNKRCSFCNKHQNKVKYLITGIGANICSECVKVCNELIKEKEKRENDNR